MDKVLNRFINEIEYDNFANDNENTDIKLKICADFLEYKKTYSENVMKSKLHEWFKYIYDKIEPLKTEETIDIIVSEVEDTHGSEITRESITINMFTPIVNF